MVSINFRLPCALPLKEQCSFFLFGLHICFNKSQLGSGYGMPHTYNMNLWVKSELNGDTYACLQVQFMTYAFGGPDEYHGKDMWRAHERLVREKGMNDHHFDVIVEHLVAALKAFNVPEVADQPC